MSIEELVAYQEDVDIELLTSNASSYGAVTSSRHLLWYLIFNTTDKSLIEIGEIYHRTHLMIRNGIRKIDDHCDKSKEFREYVGRLKAKLL